MKLIIDISEDIYNHIVVDSEYFTPSLVNAFKNGIPLEQIRDEIKQIADEEQKHDKKWAIGLRYAVKIIDNYRGKE